MARAMWGPWLASVVGFGLTTGIVGFCLGGASRPAPLPPVRPPDPVATVAEPNRGDQGRFIDADPGAAREKADPAREWRVKIEPPALGEYRGASGAIPVGLELDQSDPGVVRWRPRVQSEHITTAHPAHPTGRTSLDVDPIDIGSLDQRRWGLLAVNYPEAVRLAQHFNAGDMVEVWYVGRDGERAYLWVHHGSLLAPRPPGGRGIPLAGSHPRR